MCAGGCDSPRPLRMRSPIGRVLSAPTETQVFATASISSTGTAVDASAPTQEPGLLSFAGTAFYRPPSVIDVESAHQVQELARWGRGTTDDIEYSPDGSTLALASSLGIHLCDPESLHERQFMPTSGWITDIAFSPDGSRIVSGSKDGMVELWDSETGE
jgi:WD40 repeat protein